MGHRFELLNKTTVILGGDFLDSAYDNKKAGQQVLVYAADLMKFIKSTTPALSKQYTCPYCGEYVRYFYGPIQTPHFRHKRGSFIAKSCEKYVEGTGYSNEGQKYNYYQKISGFPLYIRKIGEAFALFMGLFPVPEDVIDNEIRNSQKIELFNPSNAPLDHISLKRLVIEEITFKPLEWLYESYYLKYANSKTQLFDYNWVSETPGISSEGALFFVSDMYSRRVAFNGKITTESNYYLAIPSYKKINGNEFLKIESVHKLAVKANNYQDWLIYKIKFTEITDKSSEFARDLHVTLVEKPKKLTPLWPPHIRIANKHIHKNECQSYYHLQSNNSIKETHLVKNVILNENSALISIGVTKKETIIPLDDGIGNFNAVAVCKPLLELPAHTPPTVEIQYGKTNVQNSEELQIIKNSSILCESNYKCVFCHIQDNYLKSVFENMLKFPEISDIKAGDMFILIHGLDIINTIHFPIKKGISDNRLKQDDDQLYQTLISQKGRYIATPLNLKYLLPHLSDYPKVKSYIQDSFRKRIIPKPAYDYLINNIFGGLSK